MKTVLPDSQQSLVQWVSQATGINTLGVKVRLRGNDLHILCEATECPLRWRTLSDLLHALQQTDLDVLTSKEQPSIYQVLVYGRKKGENRPQWCHRVHLNQLDKHLEQVEQALKESEASKQPVGGSLIISNESLARRGDPNAIAHYLSETLSSLGVGVQVKIKPHQPKDKNQAPTNRLWIFCQSAYSPDPSLLAEPIAHKLRLLKLTGYQDAIITSQVSGETSNDWVLRIDLTPPEVMLKEWARWGDVQAIARLLTEVLLEFQVSVHASLKESTLHIFCSPAFDPLEDAPAPDKTKCQEVIVSHLEAIAPQGILGATIYGQRTAHKQPAWIDWISLPAAQHSALATSALELAANGDEPATHFLLERLLNTDLEWRLKTGGIRVILLHKGDLLHVMCDAPVCPVRKQVASKVTQFVRQLKLPGVAGVRVYGRRAGNKEPVWHHGVDFVQRQRLVPEATPEFAATSEYVGELIVKDSQEPIFRVELTSEEVQNFVTEVARNWVVTTSTTFKKLLLGTQVFTEIGQSAAADPDFQGGLKVAFVWGTLGLLLTLQTDWILGQIVNRTLPNTPQIADISASDAAQKPSEKPSQKLELLNSSSRQKLSQSKNSVFNASGFTLSDDEPEPKNLVAAPLKEKATSAAILLAARSQMPSFNARQLDEQLALYKQQLHIKGHPPDVLIIGSSRALRGVDPAELAKSLAKQGYPRIEVFNFGVNGATAQVVDFIIRQVLDASELPKVILWADGSRAFNSGREDITFNAIAASAGYQKILAKAQTSEATTKNYFTSANKPKIEKPAEESNSYQIINNSLNKILSTFSSSYQNRQQLKSLLHRQLDALPLISDRHSQDTPATESLSENSDEEMSLQAVDFDGFLPLSVRFNPARYYQKHPRVTGNYDNDYKSFHIAGEQDAAFQSILQFTQSRQIPLIFINMPLTAEYLDPVRKKYEQEFQQYMLRLATNPNFIYRDFSQLWTRTNDYFSDPSHLNRFGAYEVSKKLAIDPVIPWPAK